MTDQDGREGRQFTDEELQDLVASTDSGARAPTNRIIALLIAGLALAWSLFQLWIAQPQLWFAEYLPVMNSSQTRPVHLTFAIVLAFLAYPAFKSSPRDCIPLADWALMAIGGFCAFYIFLFSDQLALTARSGLPTQTQVIIGAVGILVLLEASRRALGPALTIVGSLFLLYAYMGQGWLIPELIEHEGLSFTALINAQWLDTGGVFGIPLGVSTAFVFLFVLFGSLLDKAGAGNYFIKLAFAGLGHLRGGPAKAAVVGSAMTGLISGSSIANVVTTGTFTIPLMKRVGFTREQAGSVEVASSVNGQIMPPVMGAAAFLMVEFIGISYVEVIKHAFIPAVISYIALVYIVHLEALKKDMPALGEAKSFVGMIAKFFIGFAVAGAAFTALIYGFDFIHQYFIGPFGSEVIGNHVAAIALAEAGYDVSAAALEAAQNQQIGVQEIINSIIADTNLVSSAQRLFEEIAQDGFDMATLDDRLASLAAEGQSAARRFDVVSEADAAGNFWMMVFVLALLLAVYTWLVSIAARKPDLEIDDPKAEKIELPQVKDIYATGLHYVLPIVVLVWFLMVERQSPARSAFFATALMILIIMTQRPLKAFFRGQGAQLMEEFMGGLIDLREGLIAGARNMIGIGVATAAAGIIVATVTRTPIGTELAGLVEQLSGGVLFLMLVLIGLFSLILGMGLPTTANYIVVSSLMASVVVSLGAQEGLIVPLIAAHLFVFYFGIMADVTPPVGLASFAAAAVSGGDPIKTGFTAFFYSLRTVALPFLFIFNPTLILYGVDLGTWEGILQAVFVFVVATFAMLLFAAATQGYFLARSRIYESAALLVVAFTLFVPNVWLDMVQSPFREAPPAEFETVLAEAEEGSQLRLLVQGPDFNTGAMAETTLVLNAEGASAAERIANSGLLLIPEGDVVRLDEPMFGTPTADTLADFDFYADTPVQLASVNVPQDRLPEQVFYIPALLLLGLVILLQRRRQTKPAF